MKRWFIAPEMPNNEAIKIKFAPKFLKPQTFKSNPKFLVWVGLNLARFFEAEK